MKKHFTLVFFAFALLIISCKKNSTAPDTVLPLTLVGVKMAPDGFNYATSRNVAMNLTLKATNGDVLPGIIVSFYLPDSTSAGAVIFKGATDKNGNLAAQVSVPAYLTKIVIDPVYLGLPRYVQANISSNNTVTATLGGPAGYSGDIILSIFSAGGVSQGKPGLSIQSTTATTQFGYPAPYTTLDEALGTTANNGGKPVYLEPVNDVIPAALLSYVNGSFTDVSHRHPEYLTWPSDSTLHIVAKTDVYVTYITGGDGDLSTLAYYTYPTGNPPYNISQIPTATVIFPNTSLFTDGVLIPGNKVKLGTFNAGTSIGFILLSGAFNGSINFNAPKYYSNSYLNPETDYKLRSHVVEVYDKEQQLTLIGIDGSNRQTSGYPNFYAGTVISASTSVAGAISTTGMPAADKGTDSDGDGVNDALDDYPNDPTKAYATYSPSPSSWSTLVFEDNWPAKGDFDMNDLVLNYRYTFIKNAQNQLAFIQADFKIVAAGASFKNGFGVQLPFPASAVASVTGQKFKDNYIKLAANGVEAGQTNAVIIPFDNTDALINNPDGSFFVNTLNSKAKVNSGIASLLITLNSPIAQDMSSDAMNPFLISNERRGYEIHLPGHAPTNLADLKLFGTGDDGSLPAAGKYYLSKDNWPWALSYWGQFAYSLEGVPLTDAYLRFSDWAASGGQLYPYWQDINLSTNVNLSKMYLK